MPSKKITAFINSSEFYRAEYSQMSGVPLFNPIKIKSISFKNRVIMSPMCQYSAENGHLTNWHKQHYPRFAQSGLGGAFMEATAVSPEGRITHGCTGIWDDKFIPDLSDIVKIFKQYNVNIGIQLAHAGRKASCDRPIDGAKPLTSQSKETPWEIIAPSAIPMSANSPEPREASQDDIHRIISDFTLAAERANKAGFEMIEIHGAHGYLLHTFLSPISNKRTDSYGGGFENRVRIIKEVVSSINKVWPKNKPFFYRISSIDGLDGGTTWNEILELVEILKSLGVDVIDCSSGGLSGTSAISKAKISPGFQVNYAKNIKEYCKMNTMAVGAIIGFEQANNIITDNCADFVALGRELMSNTQWVYHAAKHFKLGNSKDFIDPKYAFYLQRRDEQLDLEHLPK
jgi:2,4-dienoyl-CoA reductase-like NADH-dependent reductase (Old Yellow Enzyme family)